MATNDAVILAVGILMFVHLAIGMPLFLVLGIGSLAIIYFTGVYDLSVLGEVPFSAMDNWALLALPLFVLTGDVIATGGLATRLIALAKALVGWLKGALGMATLFGCFFFGGTSGSASADTIAIGRIMIPGMRAQRYDPAYAAAVTASGGCLGVLVPPSLIYIIYGVVTSTSVGALFIAGVLPAIVMVLAMCVANYVVCIRNRWGIEERQAFDLGEVRKTAWAARYGIGAPALILGGIYGGIFTPTEAAAVAVAYCVFIEVVVTREMSLRQLPQALLRSGLITGVIGPIIAFSVLLSQVLGIHRVPDRLVDALLSIPLGDFGTTAMLLLILVIIGCVLEPIAGIVILMPILLPIGAELGFDPVHFGVFVVSGLALSFITPPVGINLFAASAVSDVPFMRIAYRALPFFAALVVAVLIIANVPWLALWFR